MKLERDMPQLIPMHGKRIRIYYRGINKRCTNCFGNHQRKNCKEEKVSWIKYVEQFIANFPEIPKESYGRWANIIDGMRPERDGGRMVRPEQESQSLTSIGRRATMIDQIIPKRDADNMIVAVQLTQSTSTGVQSKTTKPTTQTTRPTIQATEENESETGKEDENEAPGENNSKTVEEAEKEELYQAIQSMVASGMSMKAIEEFFLSGKTETKKRQRGLKVGRGRDRGRGRGKGRDIGRGT
jgi:hypothetical protein